MSTVFWLDDEQWAAIEPFMPKNQPGARRKDDRRILSGIFHVLRTGCRWQDWTGMLEALASAGAATDSAAIDSTYVKAQRSAFGGKGGPRRRASGPRVAGARRKSMHSRT